MFISGFKWIKYDEFLLKKPDETVKQKIQVNYKQKMYWQKKYKCSFELCEEKKHQPKKKLWKSWAKQMWIKLYVKDKKKKNNLNMEFIWLWFID